MIKFSRKLYYGLIGLLYLARSPGKIVSLKEISEREKIPHDYLEKIFFELEKKDLINSKRGICGGYFLKKKTSKIKMIEIVETLEGKIIFAKCFNEFYPKEKKCLVKKFWEKLKKIFDFTLNSISLEDLIKDKKIWKNG